MDNDTKVDAWEKSDTQMIPKTKKPTTAQLRPISIALTDLSYKLYMTIQGKTSTYWATTYTWRHN